MIAAALVASLTLSPAQAQPPPAARTTSWLQRRLELGLSEALGGSVRIGGMDVDWTALQARVRDVAISIPAEGAPPMTATMAEGRVKLAWSGLTGIAGGEIHITEVVTRGATFSLSRAWIDSWKPKPTKGGGPVSVQIDRLVVEDATAEYADEGAHVRLRTSAMDFRGDWSTSRRLLVGEVRADVSVEAPIFDHPWPASVRGGLRLGGGRLEIFGATGSGPGADGELAGTVTWAAGASFTAQGRANADLAALASYIAGDLALSGTASGPLQIVYLGGVPIRVTMQAKTTALRVGPIVTESAEAEVTVRPNRLDVLDIDGRAYDGRVTGTLGLAFGRPIQLTTALEGKGVELSRLIALTGKELPVSCPADVTFSLAGDPRQLATWIGEGTFSSVASERVAAGRIPARGRGRLTFDSGRVRVNVDPLSLADAALRLSLEADLGDKPTPIRLTIEGTTRSARATQLATLRFFDALGIARNRFAVEPVTGTGTVRAVLSTGRDTHVDLALDLSDGSYSGDTFSRAVLDLAVGDAAIDIRRIEIEGEGTTATGSARFDARTGALDRIDLTARGVQIAQILARAGAGGSVSGRLDVDLRGAREAGVLAAQGSVSARGVIVEKEIIDTLEGPIRVEGDRVILESFVARGLGFEARGGLVYDVGKSEAEVTIASARLDLAANRTLAELGLSSKGTIETSGSITIGREGPSGRVGIVASGLLLGTGRSGVRELQLGDLEGTGTISPRGFELAVRSQPSAWTFEAFLGLSRTLPLSAVLYFEDLVVGAGGVFGESADLRLKGQVQLEGDLTEPRALEINGNFDELAVRLGPHVLTSAEAFPLRLESGKFVLGPAKLAGEAAHLEFAGNGSLSGGEVSGYLRGEVDLAIIASLWSEIRGAGPVELDATLGGTLETPDLQGRVAVHDGRLRVLGYPHSFESIDAEARFSGQSLALTSFQAFLGGGEIMATGGLDFTGLTPSAYHAEFSMANVSAKFPAGFKGTYEGQITLEGTRKRALIAGRIDALRGLYAKPFDLSFFGGTHREFDAAAESPFPRNIFLDVDVVAPGNLWLRNDVARVEASGQVHVGGELARPEITGHLALVPGGTVRYRNVDYTIEHGTVELTDPKRINPYVDFRGRTRVADYEIYLHVEGTADKFDYELTSTPPLASQDIISLLVTGKTLDSLTGSASAAALPGDMAAYYFAGLLSSTFGRQIQSSLGVDQLEITPLLLKGETDPTARVTIGKRVSDTVKILFSQDIGTAQKQTYQVSWDATRRFRFIAESDTDSGVGGEVQYSQQFGGAPVALRPSGAGTKTGPTDDSAAPVAAITVLAEDGTARPELVKRAKIHVGDGFDRGRMLQGGDQIRATLLKSGFIQASVRAESVLEAGPPPAYRITYRLAQGPRITVQFLLAGGKGKRSLKKTLKSFWVDTPYTPDFWDEAIQALLEQLQNDGYYAADVTWHPVDGSSGRTIQIIVDRGKPVRLRAVRFSGVASIPLARVEKQVTSLKSQALRKPLLRPSVLADDLAAVRALYRDEGFTRVRIGQPQVSLSATGESAEVDVAIEEGPRFTVGDVTFSGGGDTTEDELRAVTPIRPEQTFSPRVLAESEQALTDHLDAQGYPDVSVESRAELSADEADVAFDIDLGSKRTVGSIAIEGNSVTREKTIAKALTFGRGDLVSKQALLSSQQQLYRSGLFANVRISFAPTPGGDGTAQDVTVKVAEAPPWSLGLGVGYDSEDGARASFLLGYANLAGRAIGIAFQGQVGTKDNRGLITLRRRRVFGNTIDALSSVLYERTVETGFSNTRKSFSIRLEQKPKPRWIRYLRYSIQDVNIYDITDAEAALNQIFKNHLSSVRLANIGVGLVRDTRDDAFVTTRGGYGSIEGNVFTKLLGSEDSFVKLFLRGSWTAAMKRGLRFATFLRIGAEQPYSDTEVVPLSERFFAGGSNTLRGFDTDSVGGLDLAGFHAGGESLLLLNEELTFPIWRSLRAEIFLDAGNVYVTLSDFDPTDLRSSAGLGFRLETPIGPIRIEYGWKLDRREGESAGELVFAIGTVF